jgi:hypothetical protein
MAPRGLRNWLLLTGIATSACALTGYDFGDYQRATPSGSAAGDASGPSASTFGIGGEPAAAGASSETNGGRAGESSGAEAGATSPGSGGACEPQGCFDQKVECGVVTDRCGRALDCGGCLWWFLECREHLCQIVE